MKDSRRRQEGGKIEAIRRLVVSMIEAGRTHEGHMGGGREETRKRGQGGGWKEAGRRH